MKRQSIHFLDSSDLRPARSWTLRALESGRAFSRSSLAPGKSWPESWRPRPRGRSLNVSIEASRQSSTRARPPTSRCQPTTFCPRWSSFWRSKNLMNHHRLSCFEKAKNSQLFLSYVKLLSRFNLAFSSYVSVKFCLVTVLFCLSKICLPLGHIFFKKRLGRLC